jgi:hypothetical protein
LECAEINDCRFVQLAYTVNISFQFEMLFLIQATFYTNMIKYSLLAICVIIPLTLNAQKPKSYAAVTDELGQKIISAPAQKSVQSLAVVPFTATTSTIQESKAFGEYLTETIIGKLSGHPEK